MRINLAKKSIGFSGKFMKEMTIEFAKEYQMSLTSDALSYITTGAQGLEAFQNFLQDRGFNAKMYHLEPNTKLYKDVGADWNTISRTSPSYGIVIPEGDSKLVEFKLTHG